MATWSRISKLSKSRMLDELMTTILGGKLLKRSCAKYITTPLEEHLWKQDLSKPVTCTKNVRKVVPKSYGLKPAERNILSALPSNIVRPFLDLQGNDGEDTDEAKASSCWKTLLWNLGSLHWISGNTSECQIYFQI